MKTFKNLYQQLCTFENLLLAAKKAERGKRFRRRLRKYQRDYAVGRLSWAEVNQRVQSWLGHANWADSYHLRKEIFDNAVFVRG